MNHPSTHRVRQILLAAVVAGLGVVGAGGVGCDDDADGPMVMQPVTQNRTIPTPTTRPKASTRPATQPAEPIEQAAAPEPAPPAFITLTDAEGNETVVQFPPARLWLKPSASDSSSVRRVRALLFSDDPVGDVNGDATQRSFYLEMELELPAEDFAASDSGGAAPVPTAVSPADLTYAEWVFRSETTGPSDAPSGIFLPPLAGGDTPRKLQPAEVLVTFNPIGDGYVEVYLVGDFLEFDARGGEPTMTHRDLRIRAVLEAKTVKD